MKIIFQIVDLLNYTISRLYTSIYQNWIFWNNLYWVFGIKLPIISFNIKGLMK